MISVYAFHWKGYTDRGMQQQTVGIGRVLTSVALERMNWQPFDNFLNSSLDYSMMFKIMKHSEQRRQLIMNTDKIQSLSVSSNLWTNIHSFSKLCKGGEFRSLTWLEQNFPEIFTLKFDKYGTKKM